MPERVQISRNVQMLPSFIIINGQVYQNIIVSIQMEPNDLVYELSYEDATESDKEE